MEQPDTHKKASLHLSTPKSKSGSVTASNPRPSGHSRGKSRVTQNIKAMTMSQNNKNIVLISGSESKEPQKMTNSSVN